MFSEILFNFMFTRLMSLGNPPIQTFSIHIIRIFSLLQQKFVQVFKVTHWKRKITRMSISLSLLFVLKLLLFVVSLTIWPLSYYFFTNNSVKVAIMLSFIIFIVIGYKILRLVVSCENNWSASDDMLNFIQFEFAKFLKQPTKYCLVL